MAVREETLRLAGERDCQPGIREATLSEPITLSPDPKGRGGYVASGKSGKPLGYLTNRHWIARDLANGRRILHASVNCIQPFANAQGIHTITFRVVTGDAGDRFQMPPAVAPRSQAPRTYSANIVGESYRQPAIRRTKVGEAVKLFHDIENEHDDRAVAVFNARGEQIGFLPRDGWLTEALIDQGCHYRASVKEIVEPKGSRRHAAVILEVVLA
ncbi:hypothetical protein GGR88_001360 [Sphingomonas jejuensis]|uniref:HIRAN domain-containing protein n=1 Tax=Sphingomonas jejuensis TaxID=904715 RepID=A0ABX0XMB5_9SPHN|nr:HIRAN domain-containing protein [Sphingomonas jejuensis]NJC33886.1 hypothetical protein [Sphingomonas jejuensis]